ncbi:hypothetical protein FGO68_gene4067 [Halteria grandinella]|uniref:Protein kinase domain-containing protein n=1 Tax=Halteria grandinella TaxID=5974 RepID=A0A8J8SY16_HALGN|nr:hypothetical protein FGO68_gene4067 [Halteria grandinella]
MHSLTHKSDKKFKLIHGIINDEEENKREHLKKRHQFANSLLIHFWHQKGDELHIYFDYPQPLIQLDVMNQDEVWKMVNHVTRILSTLSELKMHYLAINPKGVFRVYTQYQNQYVYKIADHFLYRPHYMKHYQSPQNYYKQEQVEYFKSDVFALGMLCLYCLGIKQLKQFYKSQFDYDLLYKTVSDLHLPQYMHEFLLKTFIKDDDVRPNVKQLYQYILQQNKQYKLQNYDVELQIYTHEQIMKQKSGKRIDGDQVELFNDSANIECTYNDLSPWCYYKGRVQDCKRVGKGELHFKNGSKFLGTFINDFANGQGIYTKGDFEIVGVWKDDIFIK